MSLVFYSCVDGTARYGVFPRGIQKTVIAVHPCVPLCAKHMKRPVTRLPATTPFMDQPCASVNGPTGLAFYRMMRHTSPDTSRSENIAAPAGSPIMKSPTSKQMAISVIGKHGMVPIASFTRFLWLRLQRLLPGGPRI